LRAAAVGGLPAFNDRNAVRLTRCTPDNVSNPAAQWSIRSMTVRQHVPDIPHGEWVDAACLPPAPTVAAAMVGVRGR